MLQPDHTNDILRNEPATRHYDLAVHDMDAVVAEADELHGVPFACGLPVVGLLDAAT